MGAVRGTGGRLSRHAWLLAGALCLPAACEHAQPFGAPDLGPNLPLSTTLPRQLTFSEASDFEPAWLPDGSGVIYSFQRLDQPDHDRCLGILPPEGGRLLRQICHRSMADADTTTGLFSPAVGPGGVLAYVREGSRPGSLAPRTRELVIARLDTPDPGTVVRTFPYVAPDGTLHGSASHLRWVDAHTLVYLAEQVSYRTATLPYDTMHTPIAIVRLALAGDSAALEVVPGTSGATSVAVGSGDSLFLTLAGDSRIYALDPATGQQVVVFDFGPIGPARDVQVIGDRLFAVAGAKTPVDSGGDVYLVDRAADSAHAIAPVDLVYYRRPAVSPSGMRVAAEGYGVVIRRRFPDQETSPLDTNVARLSKLWLLPSP